MDVVEFPPRMGPAKRQCRCAVRGRRDQTAEPGIAIDLEQATEPLQMHRRMIRLAVLAVDVSRGGVPRSLPRPIVDGIAPQPSGLGAPAAGVEHRQSGIIGKHFGRGEHGAQHQFVQRSQPPTGPANPVAQRRTIQRHTLASEDLRLPIQRQGVAVLADQNLSQQSLGGQPAINRTLRGWRLNDSPFAHPAAIARPADHAHPQLGGDVVQHLGAVFADPMQSGAATGAGFVVDIDEDFDPWQIAGNAPRLRLAGLGAGCASSAAGAVAASKPASWPAMDCSRSSTPCCNVSSSSCSDRRPNRLRRRPHDQPQTLDLRQRRAQNQLQRRRIVGQSAGAVNTPEGCGVVANRSQ